MDGEGTHRGVRFMDTWNHRFGISRYGGSLYLIELSTQINHQKVRSWAQTIVGMLQLNSTQGLWWWVSWSTTISPGSAAWKPHCDRELQSSWGKWLESPSMWLCPRYPAGSGRLVAMVVWGGTWLFRVRNRPGKKEFGDGLQKYLGFKRYPPQIASLIMTDSSAVRF